MPNVGDSVLKIITSGTGLDIILELGKLVAALLARAAQTGEMTEEQRSALLDVAEDIFRATQEAPPPPPARPVEPTP